MYVQHYNNDVAISYAEHDNLAIATDAQGWVDTLLDNLRNYLSIKLNGKAYQLWSRQQLSGHEPVAKQVAQHLREAATVVVLLSPSYLQDPIYQQEFALILEQFPIASNRLFVVEVTQLERPEPLRAVTGYRLWIPDDKQRPRTLGLPRLNSDIETDNYHHQLQDLAHDLGSTLISLRAAALEPSVSAKTQQTQAEQLSLPELLTSTPPKLFLAEVTDDLYMLREDVQRYLEYNGIQVLPQQQYNFGDDAERWQAAISADLAQSLLFVQLLSAVPAVRSAGMSTPQRQFDHVQTTRPELPVLQWRSPQLDLNSVSDAGLKMLLSGDTVRINPMPKFKSEIVRQMHAALQPKPVKPPNYQAIFINACIEDVDFAERISDHACDYYQWLCALPLSLSDDPPDPVAIWTDLESNLNNCDALLLLYGHSPNTWVRQQLMQMMKIIGSREPRPFVAICELDPLPKPDLRMKIPPFIKILTCEALSEVEIVQRFVQAMEVSA